MGFCKKEKELGRVYSDSCILDLQETSTFFEKLEFLELSRDISSASCSSKLLELKHSEGCLSSKDLEVETDEGSHSSGGEEDMASVKTQKSQPESKFIKKSFSSFSSAFESHEETSNNEASLAQKAEKGLLESILDEEEEENEEKYWGSVSSQLAIDADGTVYRTLESFLRDLAMSGFSQ